MKYAHGSRARRHDEENETIKSVRHNDVRLRYGELSGARNVNKLVCRADILNTRRAKVCVQMRTAMGADDKIGRRVGYESGRDAPLGRTAGPQHERV